MGNKPPCSAGKVEDPGRAGWRKRAGPSGKETQVKRTKAGLPITEVEPPSQLLALTFDQNWLDISSRKAANEVDAAIDQLQKTQNCQRFTNCIMRGMDLMLEKDAEHKPLPGEKMEDTLERVDIQKLSDLVMRFLRAFERTLLKEMRNEQMQKQAKDRLPEENPPSEEQRRERVRWFRENFIVIRRLFSGGILFHKSTFGSILAGNWGTAGEEMQVRSLHFGHKNQAMVMATVQEGIDDAMPHYPLDLIKLMTSYIFGYS